jgi:CHAT domain-containing protein
MKFKSLWSAGLGAALGLVVPTAASAGEPVDFVFSPATCEFGPEIDALFDELQAEYYSKADKAGMLFGSPMDDEETYHSLTISRRVDLASGGLTVTGLQLRENYRWVHFAEPVETVNGALSRQDPPLSYSEEEGFGSDFYHANLVDTAFEEEQEYDEEEPDADPLDLNSKSFLACEYHPFLREAAQEGKTAQQLLTFDPDPAIWSDEIAASHSAAITALDAALYDQATTYARAAVEALQAAGAVETEGYAQALWRLGQALDRLGRQSEALTILNRAFELSLRLIGPRHIRTSAILRDKTLVQSAVIPGGQSLDEALHLTFEFAALLGEDHPMTIRADNDFGRVATDYFVAGLTLSDGEWVVDTLRESHRKAQRVLGNDHPATAEGLLYWAVALDAAGNSGAAFFNADQVVRKRNNLFGLDYLPTLDAMGHAADFGLRSQPTSERALLYAGFALGQSLERRQRLTGSAANEAQKAREAKLHRRNGERHLEASWWLRESNPARGEEAEGNAFFALQVALTDATDRAVAQAGARRAAERIGPEIGELARRREALGLEWAKVEERILASYADRNFPQADREALIARKGAIEAELAAIDTELRSSASEYFALLDDEPVSADDLYAMLGEDEVLLFIVPTEYSTHSFMISDSDFIWHRSALTREDVDRMVQRLLWDLGADVNEPENLPGFWGPDALGRYPFDRGTAHELYRELIAPLMVAAKGKNHLFISTGGSLSSIPLAVLVTEPPEGSDSDPEALRGTAWLADRFAMVHIPSLRSLQVLRGRRDDRDAGNTAKPFVGFGDPVLLGEGAARGGVQRSGKSSRRAALSRSVFSLSSTSDNRRLADVESLRLLSRLPGTAQEIVELAAAAGVDQSAQFLDHRATEARFRAADLASVNVIAIATHGLLAGEVDGYSEPGLVFTPPEAASAGDDGLLTASEIAGMAIGAEWIILSACNTAAGDGSEGAPGLSGLARSFFFAGSRNLLASHWPVLDAVAPRVTVRTLELLRENSQMSRARAFQQSVREVREVSEHDAAPMSWAHPSVWAPFVLIGDR